MDMNLFGAVQEPITAARFHDWPEHMRREFALLTAEKSGGDDGVIRDLTGISVAALAGARAAGRLHALIYSDARVSDDEAVGGARVEERSPVAERHRGRGGWKKRPAEKGKDADA